MRDWVDLDREIAEKSKSAEAPYFQKIQRNVYCCTRPKKEEDELDDECDCGGVGLICADDQCINRSAFTECDKKTCPAGKECCNQRLQKRQWAKGLEVSGPHYRIAPMTFAWF